MYEPGSGEDSFILWAFSFIFGMFKALFLKMCSIELATHKVLDKRRRRAMGYRSAIQYPPLGESQGILTD